MLNPIILSDEEEENDPKTPLPSLPKKPRTLTQTQTQPDLTAIPTIFLLDDDPTPQKPPTSGLTDSSKSPSFVAETPLSDLSIVKCTFASQTRVSDFDPNLSGNDGLICVESDNEGLESGFGMGDREEKGIMRMVDEVEEEGERGWSSSFFGSVDSLGVVNINQMSGNISSQLTFSQDDIYQVDDSPDKENFSMEQMANTMKQKRRTKTNSDNKSSTDEAKEKRNTKKEERIRLMEEKKLKKEQEKLQKAALKAQAAELKKLEKEKQKWEKGKFALNSIVAEVDTRVIEHGSVGGPLLTKFADKGLTYRITSNPIERSIVWTMSAPEHISQLSPEEIEVRYVVLVYEAEEFCNLVTNESLLNHVSLVRSCYPSYTICYLTNRLMAYVNKRGKEQYKNQENDGGWRCPEVEEVLANLTTHFVRVHYRLCTDEAELAEHIIGLTCSLASCQFRKKLTRLSVNANGSFIPKDFIDKNLIRKSPWLKALAAIPKVQPRFAIAIWKKYPTMKSLLSIYMDPNKSVHEKEFLLEDLITDGLLGGERRVGQICSKRVYRILMAQSGNIKTDSVEDGADFFMRQSS